MKFVTPEQYTNSNNAHLQVNTNAVNQFVKSYPPLTGKEKVLDFGCGTGETTSAIYRGELGNLGAPGEVQGVDISQDMISHCKKTYSGPGLKFQQLDIESSECQAFCSVNSDSFDLVTSFSCLHWVPNQPAAVQFFHSILKPGGKFLFVIVSSSNQQESNLQSEFQKMKTEEKWAKVLRRSSWPYYIQHRNTSWMTTVDKQGRGPIIEGDYVNLLKNTGFKVKESKSLTLTYLLDKDFKKNYFKASILTAFPELKGDARKEFFNEFIGRLRALDKKKENSSGLFKSSNTGIQIYGEKM